MTYRHETIVRLPIHQLWAMFEQIETTLPALTPPKQKLVIESVTPLPPQVGTEIRMATRSPIGRVKWVARYVEYRPPHGTITGTEASFVDEQVSGPFKSWRHSHEFEAIDDGTTRCIDYIEYTVPYGIFGWIGNLLLVRPALRRMFAHRAGKLQAMTDR